MTGRDASFLQGESREAQLRWAPRLVIVLLLAAIVRLAPTLAVEHISPDAVEFLNIAQNWLETGKPLLSIKAYYYEQTPIVHYGGYERPLLPAILIGAASHLGPSPAQGAQWLSFFASLLMILFLVSFLRRVYGITPAFAAGLLVAVSPIVLGVSLYPWADILSLLMVVLAFWVPAFFDNGINAASRTGNSGDGRQWKLAVGELLTGIAVQLAGAMRSTNLLLILPLMLYYLHTRRTFGARLRSVFLLLLGASLFFVWNGFINIQNGAPIFMMPQGFLYRTMRFDDGIYFWEKRDVAASTFEFLRGNAIGVIQQIVKQTIAYLYILFFYHQWLFVWWLALPLILVRLWKRQMHPLILAALLTALLNLMLYCVSWSTYDPSRFLLIPLTLLLSVCVCEGWRAWQKVGLPVGPLLRLSLPAVLLAGTMAAWGLLAARESYTAVRAYQADQRFVAYGQETQWNDPALRSLAKWLKKNLPPDAVVASPLPWYINYLANRPTAYWPQDLFTSEKIVEYLKIYPPSAIVFDPQVRAADPSADLLRKMPEWRRIQFGRIEIFLHE